MAIRKGIQLAEPFSLRRLSNSGRFHLKWYPPYLVQPKLNGERCRCIVSSGRCILLSSSEDIIPAVPHINLHALRCLPDGEYDGELYTHGLTFSEIHSIVSREVNLHPEHEKIDYHIFDLVTDGPQHERLRRLNAISFPTSGPIKRVPTHIAHTYTELMNLYDTFIGEGYEGFIIRHIDSPYERKRIAGMMKFKPKCRDTYTLLSIYEATSESGVPLGMVGGFVCCDDMQTQFSVGAGKLSHSDRKLIWAKYCDSPHEVVFGRMLEVEYQTMSDKAKVPLFSRAVRII